MIKIQKICLLFVLLLAVTFVNAQAPIEIDGVYYNIIDETNVEVCAGETTYSRDIVIPPTVEYNANSYSVIAICENAFKNCTGLTSINIPANVKTIGNNAFLGCSSLGKAIFASVKDLCEIEFGNKEANPLYLSKHLFIGENEKTVIEVPAGVEEIKNFAFAGGKYITNIILGSNVNKIGVDVFKDCKNYQVVYSSLNQILNIEYGDGVSNPMGNANNVTLSASSLDDDLTITQNVKANTFKGAKWIKKVSFSTEVTSIGQNAFSGCVELSSVTLPTSLQSIGQSAFSGCKKLTDIRIPAPATVDGFGINVFEECSSLINAEITAPLVTLPDGLFRNCTSLTSVTLPQHTQVIGKNTFKGCTSLTSLPLPQEGGTGLTTISESAFYGCTGIKTLEIPGTVDIIGVNTFYNCAITNLIIKEHQDHETVTSLSIYENAFSKPSGETSTLSCVNTIFSYAIPAPATNVKAFGDAVGDTKLFYNISVDYPDGKDYYANAWGSFPETNRSDLAGSQGTITYCIDDNEDNNYEVTKSIGDVIDKYVPEREGWQFSGWDAPEPELMSGDLELHGYFTKQITVNGVKYLLKSYPQEARVIGYDNPENVVIGPSITDATIPYYIVAIEDRAFKGAKTLKYVDLSGVSTLMSIGTAIFADCSILEEVKLPEELPNDLNEITDSMFYGCSALSTIEIPANVASIGESAFGMSGIKDITLPASITQIGENVFRKCTNLEKVVFDDNMQLSEDMQSTLPQYTFDGCEKLESFTLPSSITIIGKNAFSGCSNLDTLKLENIVTIGPYAFKNCSNLKVITLPSTIRYLQDNAFSYCKKVEMITINSAKAPELGSSPFSNDIYDKAALYVTDVDKYKNITTWNQFAKIYPIDPIELSSEELVITLEHEEYTYTGSEIKPSITVKWIKEEQETLIDEDEYIVSYKDSINVGTATITIIDKEGGNYRIDGSVIKTFEIVKAEGKLEELLKTHPQPAKDNFTYTTNLQNLIKAGAIKEGISGSLKYSLDKKVFNTAIPQGKDAKEYTVYYMVEGDPNYNPSDTLSIGVTIAPKDVSKPSITLGESSYAFTGDSIKPTVTVMDGSTLIPNVEYKVSYNNNINAGSEATVIITDKDGGNYKVSGSKTFTIKKADVILENLIKEAPTIKENLIYNEGKELKLINAGSLKNPKTGILEYSLDKVSFEAKIPTGIDAGEYKVYYRVKGDANHNASDRGELTATIKEKSIQIASDDIILEEDYDYAYDGSAKKPDVISVKWGSVTFTKGTHFTVSYSNNTNVGEATVTLTDIKGKGCNYEISGTKTFTILPERSKLTKLPTAKNNTYNGSDQDLINKDGKAENGKMQYSLSQDANSFSETVPKGKNAGSYIVYCKVKGDANHSDSEIGSVKATIAPKEINTFSLSQGSYTYDGTQIKPDAIVKSGDTTISKDEYTISYTNNINVGTATVTLTDKDGGNYIVNASKTFAISKAALTISGGYYEIYEGDAIPEFAVSYDGFKNNETEAVLTKKPILRCNAIVGSKPGEYTINVTGAEAANYNITHKNGKLAILPLKFVSGGDTPKDEDDPATYQITSTGNVEGTTPTVAIIDDKDAGGAFEIPETVIYHDKTFIVTEIAEGAFENNKNLTDVIIPSSISGIGEKAFKGCSNLESITVYIVAPINLSVAEARGTTRSDDSSVFEGVNKATCVLYVPDASVELYKAAPVWKEFKHIVPMSTTGIKGITMTDDECFDIYNLQGQKVKSKATDLKGLPKGIYIINGKKFAVK